MGPAGLPISQAVWCSCQRNNPGDAEARAVPATGRNSRRQVMLARLTSGQRTLERAGGEELRTSNLIMRTGRDQVEHGVNPAIIWPQTRPGWRQTEKHPFTTNLGLIC